MAEGDETPAPAAETSAPAPPKAPRKRAPKKEAGEKPAAPAAPAEGAAAAPETPSTTPKPAAKTSTEPKRPPKAAPHRPPVVVAPKKVVRVPSGTIVDASGLVLGRAASLIAKRLLNGEKIVVINAENAVVTGDRQMVLETYRAHRARGSKRTGPHFPRYPDRIFRRTVRGMLPHLKTRGKEALDRLEVFIGVPHELQGAPHQSLEGAKLRPALRRPLTLAEISRLLGARL